MFNVRLVSCIILISLVLSSFAAIEAPCQWYGTAPLCFIGNSCPTNCPQLKSDNRGDGARCWFGVKNYCCCAKKTIDSIINTIANA
ncbi:unnamed protein product [Rotaria socialis]|nr:unnamed protein product [Rotaria socialis]CAF3566869.1 unnamed protein product [Rotaria socialis]CAF4254451.1 unnamed protein product [Rotaria socialis]CAF4309173.1 unnamed protein product [Rotaria socialis]CAF4523638.1 unnamed protein product [Rotaria socialis]